MLSCVILSLVLLSVVQSLPILRRGKLIHGGENPVASNTHSNEELDRFHYFLDQRLDHFDRSNSKVFQQRYFVNTTYWKGADSGAPVFLCVGGEGPPLDFLVLVSSVHCNDMVELAPKHGALLLSLEHRYYGPSTPDNDRSTENLRFLNSEQALGDIAHFHQEMSEKFELTSANKWVSWGGSYPGMMAAMARLRFPHLIHAAVSSSSPLQAQVDMTGYNDVVAESMAAEIVGGSQACLDTVVEGHQTIGEMLKSTEGQKKLEEQFNVCIPGSLADAKNQEQFAGDGVVYLPVQSNDPACTTPLCDIASICVVLTNTSLGEPIDRLAALSEAQSGGACTPVSYDAMIKGISNPENPERSWIYQTCTEWGFYQTCEVGSSCPYTQGLHTLDIDYDICQQAFSVNSSTVDEQIQFANAQYGGSNIQATRIMYPNGQIDPWHALGVLTAPNAQEPTLMVEGASHHFWTHPSLPTDSEFVVQARQTIWDQVDAWLLEA